MNSKRIFKNISRNNLIIGLLIGSLVLVTFSGCVQQPGPTPTPTVTETPTPTPILNYTPVATGENVDLELEVNIGKNSFARGEKIQAILKLENVGNKEISLEYWPNMPFNILLYDKDANLIETFKGERAASLVSSDVKNLKPGESFSDTLNFTINREPGVYLISGGFVGKPIDIKEKLNGEILVNTELIAINLT